MFFLHLTEIVNKVENITNTFVYFFAFLQQKYQTYN